MPASLPAELRRDIDACGYFPEFVSDSVLLCLGDEPMRAHLVHHEANFTGENIHRHLTVLVLTPTRLLVVHTDEGPDQDLAGRPVSNQAVTSTESIPLRAINAVDMSRVVSSPERYGQSDCHTVETWLTIGWGTMRRVDLEPAGCPDPTCTADHGFTGTVAADDLTLRMSPAADGAQSVSRLVAFGALLQQAAGK